jgi:hypothetical protein
MMSPIPERAIQDTGHSAPGSLLGGSARDHAAITSLTLSLMWLGGLGSLLGVIFGHVSEARARRAGRRRSRLAVTGLVVGYLGLAVMAVLVFLVLAAAQSKSCGIPGHAGC